MLFDSNTYLGHYPFRKTFLQTAGELKQELVSHGIDRALVSSLPAVFYRDCMEGNLELFEAVGNDRAFFEPCAVINPAYCAAEADFRRCVEEYGVKAIKLFPAQHDYFLYDECCVRLLKLAGELGIVVSVPASIENPLQRHPLDANRYICEEELVKAAALAPEVNFLFHNSAAFLYAKAEKEAKLDRTGKIYYDISRVDLIAQDTLQQLVSYAGPDAVILGTGAPLHYIDVQLLKLWFMEQTGMDQSLINAICGENLSRLFAE